jgi:signal transduction histidine kinase/DNA-binding response OmpR family regulator
MATEPNQEKKPLILIVDDDENAREILEQFLEGNGYRTALAEDGRQAVLEWETLAPDLILMDANMPVMNGIEACAEIHGSDSGVRTPILMVTAVEKSESVERAFKAGAEEYITKPIHWSVLKHRIKKILERQVMDEALRNANEEMEIQVLERTRELVNVNEALHVSENKFRSLVDASPDTIMILDEPGGIRFANHPPPGLTTENLKHSCLIDLLPIQSQPRFQLARQKVFGQDRTDSCQIEGPAATWWQIRITPLEKGKNGKPHSAMVIVTDRTEQHDTQSQAMRNARLATVGALAASVAHEVNNPNNAILLQTSWLAKAWLGFQEYLEEPKEQYKTTIIGGRSFPEAIERFSEFIPGIIKNSKRIGTIVGNLKRMSKPDDGKLQENIHIREVLDSVMSILANQVNKYCESCHIEAERSLPQIRGNLQQLEQVFINLILNALQALPDKTRKVYIYAWLDKETQKIAVNIEDEGLGIPKENLEKIMLPFFTTKLHHGGTGLGLAICQSILTKHNGCMEIESVPDSGTVVRVNLPVTRHQTRETS